MNLRQFISRFKKYKWISLVLIAITLVIVSFAVINYNLNYWLYLDYDPYFEDGRTLLSPYTVPIGLKAVQMSGAINKAIITNAYITDVSDRGPIVPHGELHVNYTDVPVGDNDQRSWTRPRQRINRELPMEEGYNDYVLEEIFEVVAGNFYNLYSNDRPINEIFLVGRNLNDGHMLLLAYEENGRFNFRCKPFVDLRMDTIKGVSMTNIDHTGSDELIAFGKNTIGVFWQRFRNNNPFAKPGFPVMVTNRYYREDYINCFAVGKLTNVNNRMNVKDMVFSFVSGTLGVIRSNPDLNGGTGGYELVAYIAPAVLDRQIVNKVREMKANNTYLTQYYLYHRNANTAIGDVDGDDTNEIVYTFPLYGRFLYILELRDDFDRPDDGELVLDGDPFPLGEEIIYNLGVMLADLVGDERPEICVYGYDGVENSMYIIGQNGQGRLEVLTQLDAGPDDVFHKVISGDVDNDGLADIIAIKASWGDDRGGFFTDSTELIVYKNTSQNGQVSFEENYIDNHIHSIVLADWDNDGDVDLVCGRETNEIKVLDFPGRVESLEWPGHHYDIGNTRCYRGSGATERAEVAAAGDNKEEEPRLDKKVEMPKSIKEFYIGKEYTFERQTEIRLEGKLNEESITSEPEYIPKGQEGVSITSESEYMPRSKQTIKK